MEQKEKEMGVGHVGGMNVSWPCRGCDGIKEVKWSATAM
jgi:hypothetical protein